MKRSQFLLLILMPCILLLSAGCSGMPFISGESTSTPSPSESQADPSAHRDSPSPSMKPPPIVPEPSVSISPTPPPKEEIAIATFAAVGDVLIHRSLYNDAKTESGYDFAPMFELVEPYIKMADLAMANQESVIGGEPMGLSDYPNFNSPFEIGTTLKEIGFDAVTMANNHTLDRGEQAILNAVEHWDSIGMVYTGAYSSHEDREALRVVESNGISFALLGYTYGTNGIPIPEGKDYLVNVIDADRIKEEIKAASDMADVIVVNLHFGKEYERIPNSSQKELASELAVAGADIIIGHHPHVLQPFEWIEQEDGRKTFVAYSLGNFISGQEGVYREIAGILHLEVEKRVLGEDSSIKLGSPAFLPTWTHKKNWRDYLVIPLNQVTEQQLPGKAGYEQEIITHIKQWMPELTILASEP